MCEMKALAGPPLDAGVARRDLLKGAAAVVAALSASSLWSGQAKAATPVRGGTIRAGMKGGSTTDSLDPATYSGAVQFQFGHQWGEQLVQVSAEGIPQPALAESWDMSDDAKTWAFRIRKGVQFHNGKEMTPADVVATMERHSDTKAKSGALGIMRSIESVKEDGDNVIFTLHQGNIDLPFLLDDYHLIIQPNGGKDAPAAGIGTGPYKVNVFEPGVRCQAERFAHYWRDDRGFAAEIELLVINDNTARIAALQGGRVDILNHLEPRLVDLVKRLPGVAIKTVSGRGHRVFDAHCNTAPFDNNDLRLALKYALDREEMLQKIQLGYGAVGNDTPINSAYPLFTELEQRTFDPDRAAFHYKKSGFDGTILLRTSEAAFEGAVDAAQLFQQSAAKAGIRIEVRREPADGYWSRVWNKEPFCANYWGGRPTQDQMFSTVYYSTADWNDTRFIRADFDKLVIQARAERDTQKRKELYAAMCRMVRDEGGAIVPMFNDFIDAVGPRIRGWKPDPAQSMMGGYALSKCWVTGA